MIRQWMTQREERGGLQGTNKVADNMAIGGSDNARCGLRWLPPYVINVILDNSMPLFILH